MGGEHRERLRAIVGGVSPVSRAAFERLYAVTSFSGLPAGKAFVRAGRRDTREYLVLAGLVRAYVGGDGPQGVTLSFYPEGGILTPHVARTRRGLSAVSCETLEPSVLASFDATRFGRLMRVDPEIRAFADRVLEEELIRKTNKEISLATLPALERLREMRRDFPGLENRASHGHIASYLGITRISLSRLRNALARGR
jgi:CRP-like cAMP-binding protein